MELSMRIWGSLSLTSADKRVYAWKFFQILIAALSFVVFNSLASDEHAARPDLPMAFITMDVLMNVGVFAGAFVGTSIGFGLGRALGVVSFMLLGMASGICLSPSIALFAAAIVLGTALRFAGAKKEEYKISTSSNMLSTVIQWLLMWSVLTLTQHVYIAFLWR